MLAFVSVSLAAWVQLERPHERWILYRRFHRLFEAEMDRFQYRTDHYAGRSDDERAALLGQFVADVQLQLHYEWEGLFPRSPEVVRASGIKGT